MDSQKARSKSTSSELEGKRVDLQMLHWNWSLCANPHWWNITKETPGCKEPDWCSRRTTPLCPCKAKRKRTNASEHPLLISCLPNCIRQLGKQGACRGQCASPSINGEVVCDLLPLLFEQQAIACQHVNTQGGMQTKAWWKLSLGEKRSQRRTAAALACWLWDVVLAGVLNSERFADSGHIDDQVLLWSGGRRWHRKKPSRELTAPTTQITSATNTSAALSWRPSGSSWACQDAQHPGHLDAQKQALANMRHILLGKFWMSIILSLNGWGRAWPLFLAPKQACLWEAVLWCTSAPIEPLPWWWAAAIYQV